MRAYLIAMLVILLAALASDPTKPVQPKYVGAGRILQLLLIAWTVILLAGCMKRPGESERVVGTTTVRMYNMPANVADVVEFRLSDGTHCVMTNGSGPGITCDWRRPNPPPTLQVE
jgi:hypothetical protein